MRKRSSKVLSYHCFNLSITESDFFGLEKRVAVCDLRVFHFHWVLVDWILVVFQYSAVRCSYCEIVVLWGV